MAEFTQEYLDKLNVKYQDKEIEYRSLQDLLKIRDMVKKALGKKASTSRLKTNFKKSTDC
jgi:glutaredoxin-related protein